MSYFEYKDMFYNCQNSGKYHMFIVDIAGSKKLDTKQLNECFDLIKEKMESITLFLKNEYNILHVNDSNMYMGKTYFQHGDLFGFVVNRGYKKIVEDLINQEFKDFKYDIHYNCGFYDTDNWVEGGEKYYFGYCIQQLEENSKDFLFKKGQSHLTNEKIEKEIQR